MNNLRNHYRDKKNSREPQLLEIDDKHFYRSESLGEEKADGKNLKLTLLNEELEKLEDWQKILLLMRSQDASYAAIAEITGKAEDNLKVYYQRLKQSLMEKISIRLEELKENKDGK